MRTAALLHPEPRWSRPPTWGRPRRIGAADRRASLRALAGPRYRIGDLPGPEFVRVEPRAGPVDRHPGLRQRRLPQWPDTLLPAARGPASGAGRFRDSPSQPRWRPEFQWSPLWWPAPATNPAWKRPADRAPTRPATGHR